MKRFKFVEKMEFHVTLQRKMIETFSKPPTYFWITILTQPVCHQQLNKHINKKKSLKQTKTGITRYHQVSPHLPPPKKRFNTPAIPSPPPKKIQHTAIPSNKNKIQHTAIPSNKNKTNVFLVSSIQLSNHRHLTAKRI